MNQMPKKKGAGGGVFNGHERENSTVRSLLQPAVSLQLKTAKGKHNHVHTRAGRPGALPSDGQDRKQTHARDNESG